MPLKMSKKSFKIDNSIYSLDCIIEAIDDFSSVANITYFDSILSIESEDSHEEIFQEFMNYVLALSNEKTPMEEEIGQPIEVQ